MTLSMRISAIILLLFSFIWGQPATAKNSTIILQSEQQYVLLGKQELLEFQDSSNRADITLVSSRADYFRTPESDIPHRNVSPYNLWLHFDVMTMPGQRAWITVANAMLRDVKFFYRSGGGAFESAHITKDNPYDLRVNDNPNYIFELPATEKAETYECYLQINSYTELQVPVYVGTSKSGYKMGLVDDMGFGLYAGIMLVIFLYNFFLLITIRDRSYLFYVLYILSVALTQISVKGYGFKYLWPHLPAFEQYSIFLFSSLTAFTSIWFIREFLDIKRLTPRINNMLLVFAFLYIIPLILGATNEKYLAYNLLNVFALGLSLAMLYSGIYVRTKYKSRPALFFVIAWSAFLLSIIAFVLKDLGVLPYNTITASSVQFGSAIEAILLSVALADRINILKKEKEASQEEALRILKENERIVREQNILLEQRVQERTSELKKSNDNLNHTLKKLKDAQTQLVDAEKMASLGQLTAGIAHEINNPINFVSSNIRPLRRDVQDIMSILEKYEQLQETCTREEIQKLLEEINQLKNEVDYQYVREEIELLLKGMDEGAARTVEIVKGLKNFSRLDEADIKYANMNEGILSTLILLNNQLGDKITVEKHLGNLPDIECYPGKLNQVFMNLLNNAIYAVKKYKDGTGKVIVSTQFENDAVIIRIADTGMGMTEEVKANIFDPFFTTKEVGEGTGLGLSIVYKIIDMHKGSIRVNSAPGHGAEFVITLPKTLK